MRGGIGVVVAMGVVVRLGVKVGVEVGVGVVRVGVGFGIGVEERKIIFHSGEGEVENGLVSKIGYNIEDAAARQRSFYYQVNLSFLYSFSLIIQGIFNIQCC